MKPFIDNGGEEEGSHSKRHTKVLKQFSRRPLKRGRALGEGTGRVVNGRLSFESFESLQLSGKKPAPATNNSLQKDITNTLKENVDPETTVSQNVDDFWDVERQKRLSAIARRRLSGVEAITQPVESRQARCARSHRAGGRRQPRPMKVQDYIDEGAIADLDKESLEEEEEEKQPCTIASSQAFMLDQGPALRASLNPRLEVASSPGVGNTSASADAKPKEPTPQQDKQEDGKSLVSLEDMDVSTGEHSDIVINRPKDIDLSCPTPNPTPNLASVIKMDGSGSTLPKVALEHGLSSDGNPGSSSLDQKRKPLSPGDQKKLRDDFRTARSQGGAYINDKVKTPRAWRKCVLVSSPTPPSNPLAAYVIQRRLTNELGEVGGRKLEFDSSSPCSSLDIGDEFQIPDQIPDLISGWDKITADDESFDGDSRECDDHVHVEPQEREDSKEQAGVLTQSQESCSTHVTTSPFKQETRQKLGSNLSIKSTEGLSIKGTEVDGPQTSVLETPEMEEAQKVLLSCGAGTVSPEDERAECGETSKVNQVQASALHSGEKKQSKMTSPSSLKELTPEDQKQNTPRAHDLPHSPMKSVKTKHTVKAAVSNSAKSLRFEGKDMTNSPRATEVPDSALKSATKNILGEKLGLSSTARALSFEVDEIEAIHDNEKVESLVDERQEAFEPEIVLPDDAQENASQPSAGLICQHGDITTETQTCVNRRSEPEEITAELDPCTDPQSQVLDNPGDNIQLETLEQPTSKRRRNEDQTPTEISLCTEQGSQVEEVPANSRQPGPQTQHPKAKRSKKKDPCTDPQSQVVDNPGDNIQLETLEQPTSKRRRNEDQTPTEISLCTEQGSQVEEVPANSRQPGPQTQHPKAKRSKKKDQKKRCSLEGPETGLVWIDGQRCSQRRRTRPLEWWRGEKLLYGRVHDSLTTVIGIKMSSPKAYARGERAPFLVESFVPAKYNELIRLAAI